jgi:hypothetical protein
MTRQQRYLVLLAGWLILFVGPMFAGQWWDAHFHAYQSITSLIVIAGCHHLFRGTWWADDMAVVAFLQVIHAAGDYFLASESVSTYNAIQAGLNALELMYLMGGGITELVYGRAGTAGNCRPRGDPDNGNQRKSHA